MDNHLVRGVVSLSTSVALIFLTSILGMVGEVKVRDYQGAMVIQTPFPVFSFHLNGMIFFPTDGGEKLLKHEYGHYLQQQLYGDEYYQLVVLNSLIGNTLLLLGIRVRYFQLATEREADILGGVRRYE